MTKTSSNITFYRCIVEALPGGSVDTLCERLRPFLPLEFASVVLAQTERAHPRRLKCKHYMTSTRADLLKHIWDYHVRVLKTKRTSYACLGQQTSRETHQCIAAMLLGTLGECYSLSFCPRTQSWQLSQHLSPAASPAAAAAPVVISAELPPLSFHCYEACPDLLAAELPSSIFENVENPENSENPEIVD